MIPNYSKVKLKNGHIKYVIHGVIGEGIIELINRYPGEPFPLGVIKSQLSYLGSELLRQFDSEENAMSYLLGVMDRDNGSIYFTTFADHGEIYGWEGAELIDTIQF